MASDKRGTVLVTGGTGKVGSCVSVMLDAASVPFLVASRSPSPSARNVKFDWLDRTTWDDPFEDALVSAVFIVAVCSLRNVSYILLHHVSFRFISTTLCFVSPPFNWAMLAFDRISD